MTTDKKLVEISVDDLEPSQDPQGGKFTVIERQRPASIRDIRSFKTMSTVSIIPNPSGPRRES